MLVLTKVAGPNVTSSTCNPSFDTQARVKKVRKCVCMFVCLWCDFGLVAHIHTSVCTSASFLRGIYCIYTQAQKPSFLLCQYSHNDNNINNKYISLTTLVQKGLSMLFNLRLQLVDLKIMIVQGKERS